MMSIHLSSAKAACRDSFFSSMPAFGANAFLLRESKSIVILMKLGKHLIGRLIYSQCVSTFEPILEAYS